MTRFRVQIVETLIYNVDVEAENDEAAVDAAYEDFGMTAYKPENSETEIDMVTNLDTGQKHYRR